MAASVYIIFLHICCLQGATAVQIGDSADWWFGGKDEPSEQEQIDKAIDSNFDVDNMNSAQKASLSAFKTAAGYKSHLFSMSVNGVNYNFSNYFSKLMGFNSAAADAKNWTKTLTQWFTDMKTDDDPSIGKGLGSEDKWYLGYHKSKKVLEDLGKQIASDRMMRQNELAMGQFNDAAWPETGNFALGASKDDHREWRPYIAKMFDAAKSKKTVLSWMFGGSKGTEWSLSTLKQMFKDKFSSVTKIDSNNQAGHRGMHELYSSFGPSKTIVTKWVVQVLHKIALDIDLNDADAYELCVLQNTLFLPAGMPKTVATSPPIWYWLIKPGLKSKEKFFVIYKDAIKKKWPQDSWSDKKLTMVASAFFDAIWAAGGRSVPLLIDIMMGYILTKDANKPQSMRGEKFTEDSHIRKLAVEAARYHAPVTTFPMWMRSDDGNWKHEAVCLDRAGYDPEVFPQPQVFDWNRTDGEKKSIYWADFALVGGKVEHPDSHACPGKELSLDLMTAFVSEFHAAGPWEVMDDDLKINYYGATAGWTVVKKKEYCGKNGENCKCSGTFSLEEDGNTRDETSWTNCKSAAFGDKCGLLDNNKCQAK